MLVAIIQKSDFGFKNTTAFKTFSSFKIARKKQNLLFFQILTPPDSNPVYCVRFKCSEQKNLHFGHSRMIVKLTLQWILKR